MLSVLCELNRGGTVSGASKVHWIYFPATPGPSGKSPGKFGGSESGPSYFNTTKVMGPSFLFQCSLFQRKLQLCSFPFPGPPLQSGIAPVLLSCLTKARVFWIYDARAGGRLSGDTPHCVPCSEARAGDPGPESGKASVWSPLPPPALLLRRGSNRGENLGPHARLTGADRWSVRPALPALGARGASPGT